MDGILHCGLSDTGQVRQRNEDKWVALPKQGLFLVSDGMGGRAAGALAAQVVAEVLPGLLERRLAMLGEGSLAEAQAQVRAALAELSEELRSKTQNQPGLEGMGATVALVLIWKTQALVAHMGDSRVYLLRQGRLKPLTKDHSLAQLLVDAGEITPDEAGSHPARNQLTQHMGMNSEPLPSVGHLALEPGDRLLLCTDGLTGMVNEAGVLAILKRPLSLKDTCHRLITAANAAGGRDNITVLLVSVPAEGGGEGDHETKGAR